MGPYTNLGFNSGGHIWTGGGLQGDCTLFRTRFVAHLGSSRSRIEHGIPEIREADGILDI